MAISLRELAETALNAEADKHSVVSSSPCYRSRQGRRDAAREALFAEIDRQAEEREALWKIARAAVKDYLAWEAGEVDEFIGLHDALSDVPKELLERLAGGHGCTG